MADIEKMNAFTLPTGRKPGWGDLKKNLQLCVSTVREMRFRVGNTSNSFRAVCSPFLRSSSYPQEIK